MDKWPIRLPHPTLGAKHYYLYLLQTDYCTQHKLCKVCHQPTCMARHKMGCLEYRRAQVRPEDRQRRPTRGYTTLTQATWADPMAQHYYTHPS